jgi:glycosyltransferase involved in cell wall biosynthesis
MLEAAAVGTAVIACNDAVPAVLRPYVEVFPARDVRALTQLMARALEETRARADARRFARNLTWDRCAERTAEVYRSVLEESQPG